MRPKTRWIPIVAGALLMGVLVVLISSPKPEDTHGARVAFYGDSYTLGTGASDVEARWSTIISHQRGWDEFNPSENGLGFVNHRESFADLPDLVIADEPDIVFITMGLNDNFSFELYPNEIKSAITADFGKLKKALPVARFIVVEPFWYTDARPDSVEAIIGWVREAAAAINADYIPDASHWIEGHPEWMASDGLHPNDDGYAEIAKRMDAELTKIGL